MLQILALLVIALAQLTALAQTPLHVVVFGIRQMKPDVLVNMIGLDQAPDMSAKEIKSRIQTSGLFSAVEVHRVEDLVTIYVREKTSWFVVPYFSKDAAVSTYGVAFGKATLNGTDMRLVGRYQLGTGNRAGSLLLKDSGILNSRFGLGMSFDYEDSLKRVFGGSGGREVIHRTRNQNKGGSIQASFRVSPYWSVGVNNYIESRRFEELSGEFRSGVQWSHRVYGEYNKFYVNEGLSDGHMLRLYTEATNPVSDFSFRKHGFFTQHGLWRRGNFNWIGRLSGEYSPSLPRYQLFELGGGRLRSFPNQQFRDRLYGALQNDVLLTSLNVWLLRVRPLVYLDWAFIENGGRTGVGTGFQVYVRDVAIPAVQLFLGYGFHPDGFTVAAAIGPNI